MWDGLNLLDCKTALDRGYLSIELGVEIIKDFLLEPLKVEHLSPDFCPDILFGQRLFLSTNLVSDMAAWYAFDDRAPQLLLVNHFLSILLELLKLFGELATF